MIILIDQKEYAVGLSWFAISSTQEVEQFQREMELHHGVLKMSKDPTVQSTVALCGPEYNGQISLAGMLSFAYANLIYVVATTYKDDNGQPLFYLAAIKNHAVTVDGDLIGTREEIQTAYNQNYADVMADVDPSNVNCFGSGIEEAFFPGITLVETHHVIDPAMRYAAQATIKQLGKKELSKGVVLISLGLVALAGYFIYTTFLVPPPPPPPPPKVAVAAPPPPPPPDPYKVFMASFTQTLSKEPRVTVIADLMKIVEDIPLSYDGWVVSDIQFSGESPQFVTVKLDREHFANVDQLVKRYEDGAFASLALDLTADHAIVTILLSPEKLTYIQTDVLPTLSKHGSPRYYGLVTNFQLNNVTYSSAPVSKNDFFAQTTISLAGDGLWSLMAMHDLLVPFDTLGLTSVDITIKDGKYNWKIEGIIYG